MPFSTPTVWFDCYPKSDVELPSGFQMVGPSEQQLAEHPLLDLANFEKRLEYPTFEELCETYGDILANVTCKHLLLPSSTGVHVVPH
jgi:hypothetical protein